MKPMPSGCWVRKVVASASASQPVRLISGTFGKAFGSGGAFLARDADPGRAPAADQWRLPIHHGVGTAAGGWSPRRR